MRDAVKISIPNETGTTRELLFVFCYHFTVTKPVTIQEM